MPRRTEPELHGRLLKAPWPAQRARFTFFCPGDGPCVRCFRYTKTTSCCSP
jgi:hypothetical protein